MTSNESTSAQGVRLGVPLLIATLLTLVTMIARLSLMSQLSVYSTGLGSLILTIDSLVVGIGTFLVLAFLCGVFSNLPKLMETENGLVKFVRILLGFIIGIVMLISFGSGINGGLSLDILYSWVHNKAGFDILQLQYLGGWTIWFVIIFAIFFLLTEPRVSASKGEDGKRHFYIHSKLCGILRIWSKSGSEELAGDNPDWPVVYKEKKVTKGDDYWGRSSTTYEDARFNDKIRLVPYGLIWLLTKFFAGLIIGLGVAREFATQYLVVANYLSKTGMSMLEALGKYADIFFARLSPTVVTSPTFGIDNAFAFEAFKLVSMFVFWFLLIWTVRLIIAIFADLWVADKYNSDRAILNAVSSTLAIVALWLFNAVIHIPTWVFEAQTPYYAYSLIITFVAFGALAVITRTLSAQKLGEIFTNWTRVLGVTLLIVLLVLAPVVYSKITVESQMQVKKEQLSWAPASIPVIEYTQWGFEVDDVKKIEQKNITVNSTEILKHIRVFDLEAAKYNMKPSVGNINWMSMDAADVDIVYKGNVEYWVAALTLVRPPAQNNEDEWRMNHLTLTHSEKILAINAFSTGEADGTKLFGLSETPQIYYGEGGLWSEVSEVYIDVPGFSERHLDDYTGPTSYNDKPDYVYQGFWKTWKFFWEGNYAFAFGDNDIKILIDRDTRERVKKLFIPGMKLEPDGYPVNDTDGNVYQLYWVWIEWQPPHDYLNWAGHFQDESLSSHNKVLRKLGVVLVDMKSGEVGGFLDTARDDYILSFYRSFYSQWNRPVPDWLKDQLRYPEEFLEKQIDVYNIYFQEDFLSKNDKKFLELTKDSDGVVMEDVRYIMMPLNEKLYWSGARLVERFGSPSRNLAGMYIAPGGKETDKIYLVQLPEQITVGPATALSNIYSDDTVKTELRLRENLVRGNMLLYSISGGIYYFVPFYAKPAEEEREGQAKVVAMKMLPAMVAVEDAVSQKIGRYIIKDPTDSEEVAMAATYAFRSLEAGGTQIAAGTCPTVTEPTAKISGIMIVVYGKDGREIQRIPLDENQTASIMPVRQ